MSRAAIRLPMRSRRREPSLMPFLNAMNLIEGSYHGGDKQ
jgi:hypothetical protein